MNTLRRLAALATTLVLACAGSAYGEEASSQVEAAGGAAVAEPPPRKTVALPRRIGKVDVSEAARRLEQAQKARRLGLDPRPGEFTRVSGGMRTVNYRYWKRQEKLRLDVEVAQRRSRAILTRSGQAKASQI